MIENISTVSLKDLKTARLTCKECGTAVTTTLENIRRGRLECPVCGKDFKRLADKLLADFVTNIRTLQSTPELTFEMEFVLPSKEKAE